MTIRRLIGLAAAGFLLASCATGPKVELDPESRDFYETARLIMSSEERAIFNHLPDAEARREFIREFWTRRDPDPLTEENEYKIEFERRIDHANRFFREGGPGWNTDRGRIYIYIGAPDKIEQFYTHDDPGVRGAILWWVYYAYDLGIEFVDEAGYGQFKIRQISGDFFDALDSFKLGQSFGRDGFFQKNIVRFKLDYNAELGDITILIPANALSFRDEDGDLAVDLEFDVTIYQREGASRDAFREVRTYRASERDIRDAGEIPFVFSRNLPAGTNYIDVIIRGREGGSGQARKIFTVRVR
jgi:GWxTD domain-containing protein